MSVSGDSERRSAPRSGRPARVRGAASGGGATAGRGGSSGATAGRGGGGGATAGRARSNRRARPHRYTPEQIEARRASVPVIVYPEELPVSARREDIRAAIESSQVVIISGETGSGKTTQIPKILLEMGRGITGMIGHTQPRRIAARSVAERIAFELGTDLGGIVGYQVRFTDLVSQSTLVKLMTDGILLAEIQQDPLLTRYDTIVVDEAHERSLNIDFLLGYLAGLLPRRPDLKLIITSATIDSERFAAHFGPRTAVAAEARNRGDLEQAEAPAPVVEVSGRTYPVEIRWRPLVPDPDPDEGSGGGGGEPADHDPIDQFTAICLATDELMHEGPGDILVFLSGEREIRDAEEALIDHLRERHVPVGARNPRADAVEIVPLYARLSAAEQHRIFEKHIPRRIVLATNVAETSLTVPGIRYVIDPGTARISRYSTRTKVQRLPIEPISQASANQRSGRSGRVIDGIAIRLYSEADYLSRPEFTEPEILRTSLASVILQMAALGLGDVAAFPFVEPPDTRAIRDGIAQLTEIGALEPGPGTPKLTRTGRELARLPIDPRLGRMLLEAEKNGCASEVLVIVAALSVQDVRERPKEKQQQADQFHRRFTDPTSDFLAYLNMWRYLRVRQRDLSSSAFRRLARTEYLNFLRFREWQDVVGQLRQLARPLGLTLNPLTLPKTSAFPPDATTYEIAAVVNQHGNSAEAASADQIRRSLLVGLLGNLGTWDQQKRDYEGARGTHFVIWPGSGLAKKQYDWVMAAELVETARLFARTVSRINADWIEPAAAHLVKRQYSEPFWSTRNGAAMVHEKVTLYGLTVVADRTVLLANVGTEIAREDAREMFIRHALVGGEWRSHHRFITENRELLEEAEQLENRARQRGLVADDEALFDFYDERVPDSIVSSRHFDSWWKQERRERPDLLTFSRELLLGDTGIDESAFPTTWRQGDLVLPVTYNFDPTARDDGLTIHIPISVLARVRDDGFDWLVPGMRAELAVATIRALPKPTRVQLVPAPDTAAAILRFLSDDDAGAGVVQPVTSPGPSSGTSSDGAAPVPPATSPGPSSGTSSDGAGREGEPDSAPTEPWTSEFARAARRLRDVIIPADQFDAEALPRHLRATFQVEAPNGTVLGTSKSLVALQRQLAEQSREAVRNVVRGAVRAAAEEETGRGSRQAGSGRTQGGRGGQERAASAVGGNQGRGGSAAVRGAGVGGPGAPHTRGENAAGGGSGVGGPGAPRAHGEDEAGGGGIAVGGLGEKAGPTEFPDEVIPASVTSTGPGGFEVRGYPALVAEPEGVALRVLPSALEQARANRSGVVALALEKVRLGTERVTTRWTGKAALALAASPYANTPALVEDVQRHAARSLAEQWSASEDGVPLETLRVRSEFESLVAFLRERHEDEVYRVVGVVVDVLTAWRETDRVIRDSSSLALLDTVTEVREQVTRLVYPGFIAETPTARLKDLARYLRAARMRVERAASNPRGDATAAWKVSDLTGLWEQAVEAQASMAPDAAREASLAEVRWLLEELRVSLFAQQLGTSGKISEVRIRRLIES